MSLDQVLVGLGVVAAIVLAVISLVRSGKPLSIPDIEVVNEQFTPMATALKEAQGWVYDAEQLWLSGELPKSERTNYVMSQLRRALPAFDEETLLGAVRAAVAMAKSAIARSSGLTDADVAQGITHQQ